MTRYENIFFFFTYHGRKNGVALYHFLRLLHLKQLMKEKNTSSLQANILIIMINCI